MYEYKAKVIKVIDGDTLGLDIDLGFSVFLYNQKVRLSRINTPELKTEEGKTISNLLKNLLLNKNIIIQTTKDRKDKYGRYLVEVIVDGYNLNTWLLNNHYAVEYEK